MAQSAEARAHAHRLNATAGIATSGGQPLFLSPIRAHIPKLAPDQIFSYAPTGGDPRLRELWLDEIREKNPSLKGKKTSLPVVVSGLTHGLAVLADLFVDPGDVVVLPDLYWGNYRLIFEDRMEARLRTFALFDGGGALNIEGLRSLLAELSAERPGKVILLLNFPNNPTGYSPSTAEAMGLLDLLAEAAGTGVRLLVVFDDAYFGLFYEPDIHRRSLFAGAADLHENILAVKVDGATKENLVWGFRVGFLTFASRGLTEQASEALAQKVLGTVRCSVSNSSLLSQSLLLQGMQSPAYAEEKRRVFAILEQRYLRSRQVLETLRGPLRPLPFNSGYFLCFDTGQLSAERLRRRLLESQGIGTISMRFGVHAT